MAVWQINYNGVTQSLDSWGVSKLGRKRRIPVDPDVVTFEIGGARFDANPLPFPCLVGTTLAQNIPLLSITKNGVPWFSGVVTQPDPKASGRAQSISYEVSGPWYWLENTPFQQQWVTISTTGEGLSTGTTTKSEVILGQSLDGVAMSSGDVIREVLIYAQYAYQMQPFPNTVDVNHLPPAPNPANGPLPFLIGIITPSIQVPFTMTRDKSCADIIRQMLKFSPDAVVWFDYTTSPPTLNIGQRDGLAVRVIAITTNPESSQVVSDVNLKPRSDLQVPVVVAKFQQTNEINGESYCATTVQFFPPAPPIPAGFVPPEGEEAQDAWNSVWCSQPRALVQTIDLVGSHSTKQSASIKVISRPIESSDTVAVNWALRKQPWLTSLTTIPAAVVGVPKFDTENIGVSYINTIIDPDDPLNDPNGNPNNITITANKMGPDCNQLVSELLPGGFPAWLQQAPNQLDCAKVVIEVHLNYSGTDPATMALFVQDPATALTTKAPGQGVFIFHYPCKVTNADTQTYSQLTSASAGEPVPQGFAQAYYQSIQKLSYEGVVTFVEQECSDPLPPGCTFNITDRNPNWQNMQALVTEVTEDISTGTTIVRFGPPSHLSLEQMAALFRLTFGILPSWKLTERTTGVQAAGADVAAAQHYADTHVVNFPVPSSSAATNPYAGADASDGATPKVTVRPGMHNGKIASIYSEPLNGANPPKLILAGAGTGYVYVAVSIVADANNNITSVVSNAISSVVGADTSVIPANTPPPSAGGAGTFYEPLFQYVATIAAGKASVRCYPLITSSRNFAICMGAFTQPWGSDD